MLVGNPGILLFLVSSLFGFFGIFVLHQVAFWMYNVFLSTVCMAVVSSGINGISFYRIIYRRSWT
jgi:hypothetical protein